MAWFLCEQLSRPSINPQRHKGTWIRDAERLWKMVMIMRSIPDKLLYWTRVIFYSSADTGLFARNLGEGLSTLEWLSTHLTLLAAIHVCQGHMLDCVASCMPSMQPLYLRPTKARPVVSLVSQQAITSPKLGQFLLMTVTRSQYLVQWKDSVAVSIVFLEKMSRQWEWNRDVFYEDYEDKTTLTSLILRTLPGRYEDYQSQVVCWRGGSFLFCVHLWIRWTRWKIQTLSFTSGLRSWHLTE